MPQSLANVVLHVVFSAHNLATFLRFKEHSDEMNGYIVGTRMQAAPDRIRRAHRMELTRESRPVGALRFSSETQPRADAPWAIESRPFGAQPSTSSTRNARSGIEPGPFFKDRFSAKITARSAGQNSPASRDGFTI